MHHITFNHTPSVGEIAAAIAAHVTKLGITEELPFVTFNRDCLSLLGAELQKLGVRNVRVAHWSDEFPRRGATKPQTRAQNITAAHVADLRTVLLDAGSHSEVTGVYMSSLRERFQNKYGSRYAKSAPGVGEGFFSALVNRAYADRLIHAVNLGNMKTRVWLAEAQPVRAPTIVAPAPVVTQGTVAMPLLTPKESRSGVYPQAWDQRFTADGLGPFPNFRTKLFDALQNYADGSRTGYNLVQEAASSVRESLASRDKRDSEPTEWLSKGAAERFLHTLLSRNAVFMDAEGNRFALTPAHAFAKVAKLAPTFKDEIEQDLLLHLISIHPRFGLPDMSLAAVFLMGKRNTRDTTRIEGLMDSLVKQNKIRPETDAWVIVPPGASPTA